MNAALQDAMAEIESLEQEALLLRRDRSERDIIILELKEDLDHTNDILDMLQTAAMSQLKDKNEAVSIAESWMKQIP